MKSKRKAKFKADEFLQGFAAALATLVRDFDQPTVATDIMQSNGIALNDLKTAKAEEFDMQPLRKAWRDRPRSARRKAGK